jgi:transposase
MTLRQKPREILDGVRGVDQRDPLGDEWLQARVVELFSNGATVSELSAAFAVSQNTIRYWIAKSQNRS